jgi:hypothetical protein
MNLSDDIDIGGASFSLIDLLEAVGLSAASGSQSNQSRTGVRPTFQPAMTI